MDPKETVGQPIYDSGNKQWDIPKLRELLETILPPKTSFDNDEVEHDFATFKKDHKSCRAGHRAISLAATIDSNFFSLSSAYYYCTPVPQDGNTYIWDSLYLR